MKRCLKSLQNSLWKNIFYQNTRNERVSVIKPSKKHTVDMILASEAICNNMILVYNDNIHQKIAEMRSNFKIEKWTD